MERDACLLLLFLFLGSFAYSYSPQQHCTLNCDVCEDGWYGPKCTIKCLNCQQPKCEKTTGKCGDCEHGFYGERCNETCSKRCGGSGACNRDTGDCDESCPQSYWGPRCERNCSQMCNGSVCIKASGECHQGCHDGWTGYHCNVSCGTDCVNTTCAQITKECIACRNRNKTFGVCEHIGLCNHMCDQCYKEEKCEVKSTRSKLKNGTLDEPETNEAGAGAVIGAVFGVIVIALVVVVSVIVYCRRRHRGQQRGGDETREPESETFTVKDA